MTIEIPTELLMSPWFYIILYFVISVLVIKPIKLFWVWIDGPRLNDEDKQIIGLLSFFWPVGILLCILIIIIYLVGKIYSYLIGD